MPADLPVVDAQPYYASEAPLFADRGKFADFFYLNSTGGLYPPTTHHKCMGPDLPACLCTQWNFFNESARRSVTVGRDCRVIHRAFF